MSQIDEDLKKIKTDEHDKKILDLLKENSRLSFQQIGRKTNLARDTARYRVKKLEERKIIDKYTLSFNPKTFNYDTYHVFLQLKITEEIQTLIDYLKAQKEVTHIIEYTDKWDFLITIQCKGVEKVDEIISDIENRFRAQIEDHEITAEVKNYVLLKDSNNLLDKKDSQLINLLCQNSRLNTIELGKQLNLSADTITYRLKKIKGIKPVALPNINLLGKHWYTVLVITNILSKKDESKLKFYVENNKEFISCKKIIGDWNLILTIVVDDHQEFHKKIKEFKNLFSENIKDLDTLMAYKEYKFQPFV